MAKETKSISVHPDDEQETIDLYQTFGWELQSSQEIFNRDSHLERSGNNINSITTTTNYVKLVFSRETTMPNYSKLSALENEYHDVDFPYQQSAKGWFIISGIVAMLGIFNLGTWFFGIPILAVGIVLLVFSFKKMKKFSDEYWSERSAANEKCEEILNKARSVKNEKVKEETV
ncbi:MAG: hypothetical protein E7371_04010 [Clostridiales bacterium]|nr:hypothetical protein [Clostridiales bacterium]